jgi:hypothetical protein
MRGPDGGSRRDHLRALARRVEVANQEVRIIGSKTDLFNALTAPDGLPPAGKGVHSFSKWLGGGFEPLLASRES